MYIQWQNFIFCFALQKAVCGVGLKTSRSSKCEDRRDKTATILCGRRQAGWCFRRCSQPLLSAWQLGSREALLAPMHWVRGGTPGTRYNVVFIHFMKSKYSFLQLQTCPYRLSYLLLSCHCSVLANELLSGKMISRNPRALILISFIPWWGL